LRFPLFSNSDAIVGARRTVVGYFRVLFEASAASGAEVDRMDDEFWTAIVLVFPRHDFFDGGFAFDRLGVHLANDLRGEHSPLAAWRSFKIAFRKLCEGTGGCGLIVAEPFHRGMEGFEDSPCPW